jgi:hypothetical protein
VARGRACRPGVATSHDRPAQCLAAEVSRVVLADPLAALAPHAGLEIRGQRASEWAPWRMSQLQDALASATTLGTFLEFLNSCRDETQVVGGHYDPTVTRRTSR